MRAMFVRSSRTAPTSLFLQKPYICRSCLRRTTGQPLAHETLVVPALHRTLQTSSEVSPPPNDAGSPFRKALKDAAKQKRKQEKDAQTAKRPSKQTARNPRLENWELTVGIEIHAELNTPHKLFSAAATSSNAPPNSHVALFDLAIPGTQPHFQKEVLVPAVRAAVALGCEVQERSGFDRKHYFWWDQPQGYQITQFYEPFAKNGSITLYPHDFPNGVSPEPTPITIGIKQVQMEQDTAKTVQQPPHTHLLDFNRVGVPLIEIITLPQIHHPLTAAVLVKKIQAVLRRVGAVVTGMEMGGLRADVNVSVRRRDGNQDGSISEYYGVTGLGQRTEIKNLASVKAVEDAIIAECDRQIEILENGGVIEGETRGWTLGSKTTKRLRGKEGEVDYRYMPDPDIAPIIIGKDLVQHLKDTLPILGDEWHQRLVHSPEFNLTPKDASTLLLLDDGERLEYYLEVVTILRRAFHDNPELQKKVGKVAGNWVLMELGALFKDESFSPTRVPPAHLSSILAHLLTKQITGRTAKLLLTTIFDEDMDSPSTPESIIQARDLLLRPLSEGEYEELAKQLLEERKEVVRDIVEKGQVKKVKWLVGQMMGRGREGGVEPERAEGVVRRLLGL